MKDRLLRLPYAESRPRLCRTRQRLLPSREVTACCACQKRGLAQEVLPFIEQPDRPTRLFDEAVKKGRLFPDSCGIGLQLPSQDFANGQERLGVLELSIDVRAVLPAHHGFKQLCRSCPSDRRRGALVWKTEDASLHNFSLPREPSSSRATFSGSRAEKLVERSIIGRPTAELPQLKRAGILAGGGQERGPKNTHRGLTDPWTSGESPKPNQEVLFGASRFAFGQPVADHQGRVYHGQRVPKEGLGILRWRGGHSHREASRHSPRVGTFMPTNSCFTETIARRE